MKLGVNIDHVATVREARRGKEPNPLEALILAEEAGCDSIVAHLREDRRHINDGDIVSIRNTVRTKFNMEMSIAPEIVEIAQTIKPDEITLVPEKREEITTEGGLDVIGYKGELSKIIPEFKNKNIEVSLFIDPDLDQIKASKNVGAGFIEIHTGSYAHAFEQGDYGEQLQLIKESVSFALSIGLGVNAGHGLDYKNVIEIVKIPGIETLNIGHSIIAKSIFTGISRAVKEMLEIIR
ncbi:MAG: pyridoxine 5'-phosphate synthase [Candidatus Saelkia tenebricola]|nr:pyridoxine 5'-phosphate synthase [Candidatus Saelkia tenebricola]